jgi:hypothetical protein
MAYHVQPLLSLATPRCLHVTKLMELALKWEWQKSANTVGCTALSIQWYRLKE